MNMHAKHSADATTVEEGLAIQEEQAKYHDNFATETAMANTLPPGHPGLPLVKPPLIREHRLYQADWLYRFYGFSIDEITSARPDGMLDLDLDPKLAWALAHRADFPVDVNRAGRDVLLREQRNLYKGISGDLVDQVYDTLYRIRVETGAPVPTTLLTNSEVREASWDATSGRYTLGVHHEEQDAAVLADGRPLRHELELIRRGRGAASKWRAISPRTTSPPASSSAGSRLPWTGWSPPTRSMASARLTR